MLWEYFQRYGRVYKMGFGRRSTIVVTDPEMIKQITIKEFPKFHNKATTEFHSSLSSFLPIAKDDQWKRIRTTLSPTFSAVKLKEVIPIMDEAANILGEILAEAANSGEYILVANITYYAEYGLLCLTLLQDLPGGGEHLREVLGGGVPPRPSNPDPV